MHFINLSIAIAKLAIHPTAGPKENGWRNKKKKNNRAIELDYGLQRPQ